jgi:hypothetical protein
LLIIRSASTLSLVKTLLIPPFLVQPLLPPGVDEAENAKGGSVGEEDDVFVELGRVRREEHGAGKER